MSTINQDVSHDRVHVVVRLRPPIVEDIACRLMESEDFESGARVTGKNSLALSRSPIYDEREFAFDKVLDQSAKQDEAYESIAAPVVQDVLAGYHGTILAYGQTGSGKTFTTFGPTSYWQHPNMTSGTSVETAGIIPRAACDVFNFIHEMALSSRSSQFRVSLSFFELYLETVNDLLDNTKVNLTVREDPRTGVFVDGLTSVAVSSPMQLLQLIQDGASLRATSATRMNQTSSRSHVFLTIAVEQRHRLDTDPSNYRMQRAVLTIVDLAGSERVAKSGSQGLRLEEAKVINKSLSTLGLCIAALADRSDRGIQRHVPIRDSKLTRLLRDTLAGNARTCLVATISPAQHNYDETYSTLMFARRAMSIENHACRNEVNTATMDIAKLVAANKALDVENIRLREEVAILQNKLSNASALQEESNGNASSSHICGCGNSQNANSHIEWKAREEQLITKFTTIIHHLQVEIAKQSTQNQENVRPVNQPKGMEDPTVALDQVVEGLLANSTLRQRIQQRIAKGSLI